MGASMKLIIVTVLVMMLIMEGCQSFFPIKENRNINLNDYETQYIQLDLVDGTKITSKAYTHRLVTEPSDFISGVGEITYADKRNDKNISYIYNADKFDSVRTYSANETAYAVCYLKSGALIGYDNDSYLRVSPEDGTGYFIRGEVKKGMTKSLKTSRLELSTIQDVEIKKADGIKVVGVTILVLGVLAGIIALGLQGGSGKAWAF
jgi:hypothetical protein